MKRIYKDYEDNCDTSIIAPIWLLLRRNPCPSGQAGFYQFVHYSTTINYKP